MSNGFRIALSEPHLAGNARTYLEECLKTNFVSSVGPFVDRFEREFAAYVGAKFAVACASGTAAIHVALRLLGVGPGDEVLVPSLTFIASINPITYQGAEPVLVDSEEATWNVDPALVVEELDRRGRSGQKQPKAVEVVHLLGHPADIEAIADACERHGVALVEDAAEALGARYVTGRYEGRQVGTIGKVGCFSFNGNKIITSGAGGMITTDDEALARRAKHLTTQARLPGLATITTRSDTTTGSPTSRPPSAWLSWSCWRTSWHASARSPPGTTRPSRGARVSSRPRAPPGRSRHSGCTRRASRMARPPSATRS
jgi:dTDP-4-amino-4,6-dideoxygalactose transaminase